MTEFIRVSKLFEILAVQIETGKIEIASSDTCFFGLWDYLFVDVFDRPISIVDDWRERDHLGKRITGRQLSV
ncbi:hypothetical protein GCM10008992_26680 [Halorubrum aquaticum]